MRMLPAASLATLWACAAYGTTLVAIWSPDQVLLGADSQVTASSASGIRISTACKIGRQNSSFFAFSGLVDDRISGYSVDQPAHEALAMRGTVSQRLDRFVDLVSEPLARSVELLRGDSPGQYDYLRSGHPVLQAIFAFGEEATPSLAVAGFVLEDNGKLKSFVKVIAQGNDGHGPRIIYAGQQTRIREYLHDHRDWNSGLPSELVRTLIELEIAHSAGEVGGPIDIVKLNSAGAEWVQRKSQCAIAE